MRGIDRRARSGQDDFFFECMRDVIVLKGKALTRWKSKVDDRNGTRRRVFWANHMLRVNDDRGVAVPLVPVLHHAREQHHHTRGEADTPPFRERSLRRQCLPCPSSTGAATGKAALQTQGPASRPESIKCICVSAARESVVCQCAQDLVLPRQVRALALAPCVDGGPRAEKLRDEHCQCQSRQSSHPQNSNRRRSLLLRGPGERGCKDGVCDKDGKAKGGGSAPTPQTASTAATARPPNEVENYIRRSLTTTAVDRQRLAHAFPGQYADLESTIFQRAFDKYEIEQPAAAQRGATRNHLARQGSQGGRGD